MAKAKKNTDLIDRMPAAELAPVATPETSMEAPSTKAMSKKKAAVKSTAAKKTKTKTTSAAKSAKSAKKPEKGKILVIVESPAKAKTIEKYLGSRYKVLASMGHLIDLPKSRVGVNVDNNFEPEYLTIRGRAEVLKSLVKEAKKSEAVMLASDPDREGEAIAFQIGKYIGEKEPGLRIQRITFNEITQNAIKEAVDAPRQIDLTKVDAQKARRVLDRLVGYNLSPLLWKKVKNGLSAGRVQSATLKLICDREKEVESFIPEEYWTIEAGLKSHRSVIKADLVLYKNEKLQVSKEEEAKAIVGDLEGKPAVVSDIRNSEKVIKPKAPFTTSTLQQTAANRLGFTSKKTMQIAQKLYEGISMGAQRAGLISYMRTDSTRISEYALAEARRWIAEFHPGQLPSQAQHYSSGKQSQDAHEAIRPTRVDLAPDDIARFLQRDELRLYALIWERFVASQMIPAVMNITTADIAIGEGLFRVSASSYVEEGFYKVIKLAASKEEKASHSLALEVGQALPVEKIHATQHFTQGPARYNDASIIKALEELGIGRPSTYAPTISTLLERYYVSRQTRQLAPTLLGKMITEILSEYFPDVIDTGFTSSMERLLDQVEEEKVDWVAVMKDFYFPFKKRLDEVMSTLTSKKGQLDEATDIVCELCGKPMVKKLGRFGFFLACSGFPACKNTKSIPLAKCPKCGGDIVERKNVKGKRKTFYGCTNYPTCDFMSYDRPTDKLCPKCGWFLVEKTDKVSGVHKVCINPSCDYLHAKDEERPEE
ncbi:MAG TPA: type I DNA topoisomerase [Rectinemataceae bacterium]|nr:type I DNA topoisomerase [Rectinemataceae bacterium]